MFLIYRFNSNFIQLSKDLSTATTPLFRKTRSTQQEINYVSFLEDTVADEVQSDSSDDEFEANSDESGKMMKIFASHILC